MLLDEFVLFGRVGQLPFDAVVGADGVLLAGLAAVQGLGGGAASAYRCALFDT